MRFFSLVFLIIILPAALQAQALIDAIKTGDRELIRKVITPGKVNETDENGATALMWAVYGGDLEIVKLLVDKGADAAIKGVIYHDDSGESYYGSILVAAAGQGHIDVVRFLIEEIGLDVNERELEVGNELGSAWTPLLWAAYTRHSDVFKALLSYGADPNSADRLGYMPVHVLSIDNYSEMIMSLLEYDVDINSRIEGGLTALHIAGWNDHMDLYDLLVDYGADTSLMDDEGRTAMGLNRLFKSMWTYHKNIGQKYFADGEYKLAIASALKALEIAEKEYGLQDNRVAIVMNDLGVYCSSAEMNEVGFQYLFKAKRMHEANGLPDIEEYIKLINNLAFVYRESGGYYAAIDVYENAKRQIENIIDDNSDIGFFASKFNYLAGLYRVTKQYDKALPLYIKAQEIAEESLGFKVE